MADKDRDRRQEIDQILAERTLNIGLKQRIRIRKVATAALKTNAGERRFVPFAKRRRTPRSELLLHRISHTFNEDAAHFGRYMADHLAKEHSLCSAVAKVLAPENAYPFLIIRNLLPTRTLRWSETKNDTWYIRDRVYDFVSSGLIHLTGETTHRKKDEGGEPRRVFRTDTETQKFILSDGNDLPLRFRQATPELKFVSETARREELAARLLVLSCIENPIADPIYLMPTSEIFAQLTDKEITDLEQPRFTLFDRFSDDLTRRGILPGQRVVVRQNDALSHWMSIDINRMDLQTNAIDECRASLSSLLHKIAKMDQDPDPRSLPIVLKRGDVLIFDNYRVLYRRREQTYSLTSAPLWGRGAVRWLVAYYGFPNLDH